MEMKISSLGTELSKSEQRNVQGSFSDNCAYYSAGIYSNCIGASAPHEHCTVIANEAYNRCREGFPMEELPE